MPEIILSDITIMRDGYCVIGLDKADYDVYRSVRPLPPSGYIWPKPFHFKRGDIAGCRLSATRTSSPHFEDRQTRGLSRVGRTLSEEDLVEHLHKAEVASDTEHLFECAVSPGKTTGLCVEPDKAKRSVCGCEYRNIRLNVRVTGEDFIVRSEVGLSSGERLSDIRLIDGDWRRFIGILLQTVKPLQNAQHFLNRLIHRELHTSPHKFARIGLSRPWGDNNSCWLMLDSLFPSPNYSWLEKA